MGLKTCANIRLVTKKPPEIQSNDIAYISFKKMSENSKNPKTMCDMKLKMGMVGGKWLAS